jgi:hypothetical protein
MAIDPLPFLENLLTQPRSATVDGNTVEQQSLKDILEALKWLQGSGGGAGGGVGANLGLRFRKLVPPGTTE